MSSYFREDFVLFYGSGGFRCAEGCERGCHIYAEEHAVEELFMYEYGAIDEVATN